MCCYFTNIYCHIFNHFISLITISKGKVVHRANHQDHSKKSNCIWFKTLLQCLFFAILLHIPNESSAQTIVPTFNSLGIYWPINGDSSLIGECNVFYKPISETIWRKALPLWFDARNSEFRGSIVHLESDEKYQIKLQPEDSSKTKIVEATTWSEQFPIADTVYLPSNSNETLVITKSGSEDGYILYTHAPGDDATINVNKQHALCIDIKDSVSHVIIRGLTLLGAQQHGIRLRDHVNNIVIEENDISKWGSRAADGWGLNRQSAIFSAKKDEHIKRIIIQYNQLHHPSTNANSWDEKRINGSFHPSGPQAIHLAETEGNHVIRFNDIYSDSLHYFNDGIGAAENFSFRGFPNCDSDIYHNNIAHCWDDGIESEGANKNVRIWGNYIDSTYVKIAIAATATGPLYIWRNVAITSRKSPLIKVPDENERGPFIKAGGRKKNGVFYGAGKTFIFHNTVLQPILADNELTSGSGSAIQASGGYLYNVVTRNNIFLNYKPWQAAFLERADSCTNDFDFDLYNGKLVDSCDIDRHEQNGIQLLGEEKILFDSLNTIPAFTLSVQSKGIDAGVIIPNFNDDFEGKGPDLGAVERGKPAVKRGEKGLLKGRYLSTSTLLLLLSLGVLSLIIILFFRKVRSGKA